MSWAVEPRRDPALSRRRVPASPKGPCRISWEAVEKPPALADPFKLQVASNRGRPRIAPHEGVQGDASLAGPSRVLSRLRHRRAAACALSRRGALRGRSCSRGALEVPCRTRCGLSCIIGCLTIRRWLGLRCLGALRYRKDCVLDIRRYDAGAMCRVFRRYVGVYAPSS